MAWLTADNVREFAPGTPTSQDATLLEAGAVAETELREACYGIYGSTEVGSWVDTNTTPAGIIDLAKMLAAAVFFQKVKGYHRDANLPNNRAAQLQLTVETRLKKYSLRQMQLKNPATNTVLEPAEAVAEPMVPDEHLLRGLGPGREPDDTQYPED